jgi:hypothetical protein
MRQLIEKLVTLEGEITIEKGPLNFFGLFLREEAPNKWDVVVSAPWLEENQEEGLAYVANQLQSHLDLQELLSLSRIVVIDHDNPGLESIQKTITVEHGVVEFVDRTFFGLEIKHAYIITSRTQSEMVDIEAT